MEVEQIEELMRDAVASPKPWNAPRPVVRFAFLVDLLVIDPVSRESDILRAIAALRNLVALPRSLRDAIEPKLFTFYCKQVIDDGGNFDSPQEQLDWEANFNKRVNTPRHAHSSSEVWPLVRFVRIRFYEDERVVGLWGEAAWDGEHGCGLYFAEGGSFLGVAHNGSLPK